MTDDTMGNQQATQSDIGWLAGIIDGEGHIGLSCQNRKRCSTVKFDMSIVNTDDALIEKTVRILRALGANPYIRGRIHEKKSWSRNTIVTVCKMAHIERVLSMTVEHLTGVKKEKAILLLALIRSRKHKNRMPYDDYENSLVNRFRDVYVGNCGASTTAREALAEARRRYSLSPMET